MLTEQDIAAVCYAALNALQRHVAAAHSWEELPGDRREVIIDYVRMARMGLPPHQIHDLRVEQYTSMGWRYGPVRDDTARVAPGICPWAELDGNTRRMARIFHVMVMALTVEDFAHA